MKEDSNFKPHFMPEMPEESLNVLMTKPPDESLAESKSAETHGAETNCSETNGAGTNATETNVSEIQSAERKIRGPLWWNLAIAALAAGVVVFNLMRAGVIPRNGAGDTGATETRGAHAGPPGAVDSPPTFTKPGGYKANLIVLTGQALPPDNQHQTIPLDNLRRTIPLDSQTVGLPIIPGEAIPIQRGPGLLSYLPPGQQYAKERVTGEPTAFHTLTVPRGGTFMVILPDGSKVWLNNESSLRYPVHFSGAKRVVEVTGEAYFIVAPDPSKPFIVKTKYGETRVLHTRLMITAYGTETRQTFLVLEGSVQVKDEKHDTLLNSGQQLEINGAENWGIRPVANPEEANAWARGMFNFQEMPLSAVLKTLGRWYDLEVDMGDVTLDPTLTLTMVSRDQPLENFLHSLESNGIHLRIEGRKILCQN